MSRSVGGDAPPCLHPCGGGGDHPGAGGHLCASARRTMKRVVTQYPMTTLEELGLLKMDFLGLRNLTVIHDAEEMIRQTVPDFRYGSSSHGRRRHLRNARPRDTQSACSSLNRRACASVITQLGPRVH